MLIQTVENKINIFLNKPILSLVVIGVISLILRLVYFPFDIPVSLDSLHYFWYASDINLLKGFPTEYGIGNGGWPVFLASIFSFLNSSELLDYMNLQRTITIIFSTITIVPVYFICRKFFNTSYSVIGAGLFAFEPRIIQNSLLGITDPLYVILSAISFALFFAKQKKFLYLSFIVAGFAAFVRSEGIFIFVAFSIVFFISYRKKSKKIKTYFISLILYFSTILPVIFWRIHHDGSDLISGRITVEANNVLVQYSHGQNENGLINYITHAIWNFIQLGGWSLIPVFIIFVLLGVYFLLKFNDVKINQVFILTSILLIPVFFAFSIANDVRYIFYVFPLFCVISIYSIKKIGEKIKFKNIFLILIISIIIVSSLTFLQIKTIDNQYQKEVFQIGKEIIKTTDAINDFYPQSAFLQPAAMLEKWPILKSSFQMETIWDDSDTIVVETSYDSKIRIFNIENYNTLEEFIGDHKNKGLTHIIIDDYDKRSSFLKIEYFQDKNYPYLKKVFDSKQNGFNKYHLKIYEIDYKLFNDEQ